MKRSYQVLLVRSILSMITFHNKMAILVGHRIGLKLTEKHFLHILNGPSPNWTYYPWPASKKKYSNK
jgi:hypothetical protein